MVKDRKKKENRKGEHWEGGGKGSSGLGGRVGVEKEKRYRKEI